MGVADLIAGKADVYADDQSGKFQAVDVPAEVKEAASSWREKLVEMVAESNEDLMEAFFEKGTLTEEDLLRGLRQAVLAGRMFPVLPASSAAQRGAAPAARRDRGPAALARGPRRGQGHRPRQQGARRRAGPTSGRPFSAFVFKTHRRPARRPHLALPRVLRHAEGRQHRAQHHAATWPSAWARLVLLQGKTQTPVPEIQAGDIGARGQAQGDPDRRHARRQGAPHRLSGARLPGARHHLRHRAQDARRRGQDLRGAAPPDGGGPGAAALARRADPRDAALRHGPAPRRGGRWAGCASATRSRSTSRSPRSPTGRRSRPRRRATAGTRSRPAATASSATARSA